MVFNRDDDFMFQTRDIVKYEVHVLFVDKNITYIFM